MYQYEKHPYPSIPFLALPKPGQGIELQVQTARRILVVGCGTFETAVVAQMHPNAKEIVAIDLSHRSTVITRKRLRWLKIARPLKKLPPVRIFAEDARALSGWGKFDYIIASNVLHHVIEPEDFLRKLSAALTEDGLMRVVTYPKGSRFWMRKTAQWLKTQGLHDKTPSLVQKCHQAIRSLAPQNPIRSCFESQPETRTLSGLIDAFFNGCEHPLSPLEWETACGNSGLTLVAEKQNENSQSTFIDSFLRNDTTLSPWEKLQVLDDTLELCANPILWLRKTGAIKSDAEIKTQAPLALSDQLGNADQLLRKAGSTLQEFQAWLKKEVGPRISSKHPDMILRGLSITEYELDHLLSGLEPDLISGLGTGADSAGLASAGLAASAVLPDDFL